MGQIVGQTKLANKYLCKVPTLFATLPHSHYDKEAFKCWGI